MGGKNEKGNGMRQNTAGERPEFFEKQKSLAAVWLCAAVPIALYLVSLFVTARSYPRLNEQGPLRFLVNTVSWCFLGWVLGWLIRWTEAKTPAPFEEWEDEDWSYERMKRQEAQDRLRRLRKLGGIVFAVLVWSALNFLISFVSGGVAVGAWKVKEAVCCIWPLVLVVLFQGVWDLGDAWTEWYVFGLTEFIKALVYFALAGGLIWLLQNGLVVYDSLKWEPVETVFLLLMTGTVLLICRGRLKSRRNRLGILLALLFASAALFYFFFREHYRVCEILYNLGIEAAKGGFEFRTDDWLSFRKAALLGNLTRDISCLNGNALRNFSYSNPLAFLNFVSGPLPVLLLLLWLAALIWNMIQLVRSRRENYLSRMILWSLIAALILKIGIGTAMDALLVTSAGIEVPLLGYSADAALLALFSMIGVPAGDGRRSYER